MADAATMKPKLIPDDELLPRDNSGGRGYEPRHAVWGDGDRKVGEKSHLSVSGGSKD